MSARKPLVIQAAVDANEARARFVYVDDAGAARELTAEECTYLATPYHPADGARPYVKKRYDSRTPDGRLRGFLERTDLPYDVPGDRD